MSRLISREYLESQQYPSRKPSSLLDHDFDDEIPEKQRFTAEMLDELLPDGDMSPQLFAERSDVPAQVRVGVIATRGILSGRWYEWLARVVERAGTRCSPKFPAPPVVECATAAALLRAVANDTADMSAVTALIGEINTEFDRVKFTRGAGAKRDALTVASLALHYARDNQRFDAVQVEELAQITAHYAQSAHIRDSDEYAIQLADAVELSK